MVHERIDAGRDFVSDFDDYVTVSVAFWLVPANSDNVYLYIASDDLNDGNIRAAYGEVLRRLHAKSSPWLNPFHVKLVSSSDPVACEAMKIRDRYPATVPTRYQGSSIGGLSIDGAYIYPPLSALKSAS